MELDNHTDMRAEEFISENRGKPTRRMQQPTVGSHTFWDPSRTDSTYTLNRVMMAAASTDGTFVPEIHGQSWVGNDRTAHPYTEEEHNMLKKAYQAVGAGYKDLNRGDLRSMELETTNKVSPVKAFRGYAR
jgi:hypothetical protein